MGASASAEEDAQGVVQPVPRAPRGSDDGGDAKPQGSCTSGCFCGLRKTAQKSAPPIKLRLRLLGIPPSSPCGGYPADGWSQLSRGGVSDSVLRRNAVNIKASDMLLVGCVPWGGLYTPLEHEDVPVNILRAAVGLGIREFDTAPHYGLGVAESRLGRALEIVARDGIHGIRVHTKVGRVVLRGSAARTALTKRRSAVEHDNLPTSDTTIYADSPPDAVPILDYSDEGVEQSFHDSLSRLWFTRKNNGRNRLVSLRVHDAESASRLKQVCHGGGVHKLRELRDKRLIDEVSIGMCDPKYILQLIKKSPKNTFDSVMMASSWNLLDPTREGMEVLHLCQEQGIKVHLAGVFASGMLVGKDSYRYSKPSPQKQRLAQRWTELCERYSLPLPAVALAFAMMPQVVSKVAVGVRSPEELEQCCYWAESFYVPLALWEEAVSTGLLPEWIPIPLRKHS